ncbi:MAG: hypothetical protein ABJA66_00325 [Actinomycetota bacterium]
MEIEERVKILEQATITMRDLVISHDERPEDYFRALRESRKDFDFKLNALIDAQLRNETGIEKLREASESQLKRIENLENK